MKLTGEFGNYRHKLNVQVKVLDPRIGKDVAMPQYGTAGAAGMDMMAAITEPLTIAPGEAVLIDTGLSIFVEDPNYAAILLPRSGLGHKQGLVLGNLVGLIDSDYQGPLKVSLWNRSNEPRVVSPLDRIAQLVVIPVMGVVLDVVDEFKATERGAGGFGSTGVSAIEDTGGPVEPEGPKVWSVFREGTWLTGPVGGPRYALGLGFCGQFVADTFEQACRMWLDTLSDQDNVKVWYDPEENSYCGNKFVSTLGEALQTVNASKIRPGDKLWPVWREGCGATGLAGKAAICGYYYAPTFREACMLWANDRLSPNEQKYFDAEKLTFWGCGLFDNEVEARRAFG